jgi:hypothetical protein
MGVVLRGMTRVIDAPLLDYVFQPLADRLGGVGLSPFTVARFFIDGAAVTLPRRAVVI